MTRRMSGMSSERRQRIKDIEDLLATGTKSTTNDGQSTSFDHDTLRAELRRLKVAEGLIRPREKVTNIFLG